MQDLLSQPFALLLGRRTCDLFAVYWPHVRADTLEWQSSHAREGYLADAVRTLKQQTGANLLTRGSADMVRQLLSAGLVDELRLMIYPVELGCGERLFGNNAQPSAFSLVHSTGPPAGVLLTRCARSGAVRTGTFEEC